MGGKDHALYIAGELIMATEPGGLAASDAAGSACGDSATSSQSRGISGGGSSASLGSDPGRPPSPFPVAPRHDPAPRHEADGPGRCAADFYSARRVRTSSESRSGTGTGATVGTGTITPEATPGPYASHAAARAALRRPPSCLSLANLSPPDLPTRMPSSRSFTSLIAAAAEATLGAAKAFHGRLASVMAGPETQSQTQSQTQSHVVGGSSRGIHAHRGASPADRAFAAPGGMHRSRSSQDIPACGQAGRGGDMLVAPTAAAAMHFPRWTSPGRSARMLKSSAESASAVVAAVQARRQTDNGAERADGGAGGERGETAGGGISVTGDGNAPAAPAVPAAPDAPAGPKLPVVGDPNGGFAIFWAAFGRSHARRVREGQAFGDFEPGDQFPVWVACDGAVEGEGAMDGSGQGSVANASAVEV